jgi:hypothetical protein
VIKAIENARALLSDLNLKSGDDGWDDVNGTVASFLDDVAKHLGVIYRLELVPAVSATEAFMDVSARVIVPEISSDMQFVAV